METSPDTLRNTELLAHRGHDVAVFLVDGTCLRGKLLDHDDTGLTLQDSRHPRAFLERHAVMSVQRV